MLDVDIGRNSPRWSRRTGDNLPLQHQKPADAGDRCRRNERQCLDHRGNLLSVTSGKEVLKAYGFDTTNRMSSSVGMIDGIMKKATYQYKRKFESENKEKIIER